MTIPVIRKRAKRPKTRTGCRTCKSRHVRCDEARPVCERCSSSRRECGGYEVAAPGALYQSSQRRTLLPNKQFVLACSPARALSESSVCSTASEGFAIDFFRGQTTFQLPGWTLAGSWEDLALCLSRSERAIRSGIIALGTLLRARGLKPPKSAFPTMASDHYNIAMRHYSAAVADVRNQLASHDPSSANVSIETILISCIIFICIEGLQASYEQAEQQVRTGLRILSQYLESSSTSTKTIRLKQRPTTALEIISHTFVVLDYDNSMFGTLTPVLTAFIEDEGDGFDTLESARLHLNALTNEVCMTQGQMEDITNSHVRSLGLCTGDRDTDHCRIQVSLRSIDLKPHPALRARISEAERRVNSWSDAFAGLPEPFTEQDVAVHMMLQVQFVVPWLIASIWRNKDEMKTDEYLPVFIRTVNLAEKLLTFRPDPTRPDIEHGDTSLWQTIGRGGGMILTLYLIAQKCRDSVTRFKAVELLERLQLQEGILSSNLIVPFGQKLAEIEEARARKMLGIVTDRPLRCEDVPEAARLLDVTINPDMNDYSLGRLICAVPDLDSIGGFELTEEKISLTS